MPPLLPHARRATATSVGCRVAYVISPARAKCYRDGGWRVDCRFTSPACAKGYLCGGDGPEATRHDGQLVRACPAFPCAGAGVSLPLLSSPPAFTAHPFGAGCVMRASPGCKGRPEAREWGDRPGAQGGECSDWPGAQGRQVRRSVRYKGGWGAGRRMRRPAKYEGRSGTKVSRARRAVTFPSESMTFASFLIRDICFFCEHRPGLDPAQASPADPCRTRARAGVPRMCPGIRRVTA